MTEAISLRDTLIEAGMALLEEGGIEGLTLRKAAARAGVSHAAPAHHFAGLPGLLTAITARAFAAFLHAMEQRVAHSGPDPFDRLQATCAGYLDFAAGHSGLFHLMFTSPLVQRHDAELQVHATRSYMILREACLPFSPDGQPDPLLETAIWSLVHGYAALGLAIPEVRRRNPAPPPEFSDILTAMMAARSAAPLAPPGKIV